MNTRDEGFEFESNDCMVKAIQAVTGVPYRDAHAFIEKRFGRKPRRAEGLVVRPAGQFHFSRFSEVVGKYVRKGHVQTDEHWMEKPVEFNGIV